MTLVHLLQQAATRVPERGMGYLHADGSVCRQPYPSLLQDAARVLAGLRQAGMRAGNLAILALSENDELVPALWGCLLGGIVPVPLPAPVSLATPTPALDKLRNVWQVLRQPRVLVSAPLLTPSSAPAQAPALPADACVPFSALLQQAPATGFHAGQEHDTAVIQFSSGSTGQPKGVVLSHANIVQNMQAIITGLSVSTADSTLNWLPLSHDMGLIGFHLAPLFAGLNQWHLHTTQFIKRPLLWLDRLAACQATITAAPNFSQALLLRHLQRHPGSTWDLSLVRLVLNGGEPIAVSVMQQVMTRLAACRLAPSAMLPVYGLAEAVLAVTFPPLGEAPWVECVDRQALQCHGRAVPVGGDEPTALRFASVGVPVPGCAVRLVDAADQDVPEGQIGHIQVRGAQVMNGYYGNAAATQEAFCGAWLRTGDLGFVRAGRLCVTGRAKDVLFVHGQNYYAHDLEALAAQVDGVRPGRVAVCGWHDPQGGGEKVLLFLGGPHLPALVAPAQQVQQRLQRVLGLHADVVIPLTAEPFPRTSSGKLQRYLLRERFLAGRFDAGIARLAALLTTAQAESRPAKTPPRTRTEQLLHRLWCEELTLGPEAVGVHDHFADLGGQSIHAVALLARLETAAGLHLHAALLAAHPTIAALAAYVDQHPTRVRAAQGGRTKPFGG